MTVLSDIIDRMVDAGMSAGEAGAIVAEVYAAGVASASQRSNGAERTRRWRHKASQNVTERHTTETSPNVTKRHEPSQCDASAVSYRDTIIKKDKRQNSERPSRGTRIASDWSPSSHDRHIAKQEGFSEKETDREALRFRDYWTGRAGSGGVKLDWAATWRNWVRTSAEKLGKTPQGPASGGEVVGFYAAFGSEEQEAWDRYGQAQRGRSFPRDKSGGWRHPTRWPPGYTPPEKPQEQPPAPLLRAM